MKKVIIGVVGCGDISKIYLENLMNVFSITEVKGCCDLIQERVAEKQGKYGFEVAYKSLDEMLQDDDIEIVVVLTQPLYHNSICLQVLEAGKHVYVEKPLSPNRKEGMIIKKLAESKGLLVCGAPDTFLGASIQTCRSMIEDGWIGNPIGVAANMKSHGTEAHHPDPEFYYQVGGGPMFDMGPYYLTTMINLLGPVASVAGSTAISFSERTITNHKRNKFGKKIKVEVPTHIAGIMNFESGAVGTIVTSFDIWRHNTPFIEIYGTEGSLSIPDPNYFSGPQKLQVQRLIEGWYDVPLMYEYAENSRGLGIADMAVAIRTGRKPRANIDLLYHVVDIMEGFHDAAAQGKVLPIMSTCEKPAQMEKILLPGEVK
ncbi:MAG: Gfo/Idh/MocA family oxidoreductase [Clostridiales bacterium]|nr:Gfo/Idh/MocA family oxidoreductase [Clostridiales bacterium]